MEMSFFRVFFSTRHLTGHLTQRNIFYLVIIRTIFSLNISTLLGMFLRTLKSLALIDYKSLIIIV